MQDRGANGEGVIERKTMFCGEVLKPPKSCLVLDEKPSISTTTTTQKRRGFMSEFISSVWELFLHAGAHFSGLLLLLGLFMMNMVSVSAANDAAPANKEAMSTDHSGIIKHWMIIIGGAVAGGVLLIVLFNLLVWYLCSRTRRLRKLISSTSSSWQYEGGPAYTEFSYKEILDATNNFDETRVIGEGGYGKVYLGTLGDGKTSVAIKRGSGLNGQGEREFKREIELLSTLRHHNLISLIGHCEEKSEMILVYEYMDQGTLRELLHHDIHNPPAATTTAATTTTTTTTTQPLTWNQRLKVAIDAATGLHYLHTGSHLPIIHRDVKTTNILLDTSFVTKVSDFGLSKALPPVNNVDDLISGVKGSIGYLDPEYFQTQLFTDKSDVYSFGVVLFELLCARPALDKTRPEKERVLSEWALSCHRTKCLDQIIDPCLQGIITPQCMKMYVQTAVNCLAPKGKDRPSMGEVLVNLQRALQLQERLQECDDVSIEMPPDHFDIQGGMPCKDRWNDLTLYPP